MPSGRRVGNETGSSSCWQTASPQAPGLAQAVPGARSSQLTDASSAGRQLREASSQRSPGAQGEVCLHMFPP